MMKKTIKKSRGPLNFPSLFSFLDLILVIISSNEIQYCSTTKEIQF